MWPDDGLLSASSADRWNKPGMTCVDWLRTESRLKHVAAAVCQKTNRALHYILIWLVSPCLEELPDLMLSGCIGLCAASLFSFCIARNFGCWARCCKLSVKTNIIPVPGVNLSSLQYVLIHALKASMDFHAKFFLWRLKLWGLNGNPPQSYYTSPAISDHTALRVIQHRSTRPVSTPAIERLVIDLATQKGMESWVDHMVIYQDGLHIRRCRRSLIQLTATRPGV